MRELVHYRLTLEEHRAARGSYVDPARYAEGHRDYMPEMACRTGDGHAHKSSVRDWSKVTCDRCLHHRPHWTEAQAVTLWTVNTQPLHAQGAAAALLPAGRRLDAFAALARKGAEELERDRRRAGDCKTGEYTAPGVLQLAAEGLADYFADYVEENSTPAPTLAPAAKPDAKGAAIAPEVLAVLARATTDGNALTLGSGKLPRPLYEATDKVLTALGGKWNRKAGAHLFDGDAAELLGAVLASGRYVDMKKALQAFYTPPELAQRVAEAAEILPGMTVLEPSAGAGALATAARAAGGLVTCMEIDAKAAAKLEAAGFVCAVGDFLEESPDDFDRVVMNPPFSGGQDVRHVLHAAKFVRAGGRLVAIMSPGFQYRQTQPYTGFRAWLEERGATVTDIPAGTFAESGTQVATVLVVVDL